MYTCPMYAFCMTSIIAALQGVELGQIHVSIKTFIYHKFLSQTRNETHAHRTVFMYLNGWKNNNNNIIAWMSLTNGNGNQNSLATLATHEELNQQ